MSRLPALILDELMAGVRDMVVAAGGHVVIDYTTTAGIAQRLA